MKLDTEAMIPKAEDKSLLIEMEIEIWELPNLQPNNEESFVSSERRPEILKADSKKWLPIRPVLTIQFQVNGLKWSPQ